MANVDKLVAKKNYKKLFKLLNQYTFSASYHDEKHLGKVQKGLEALFSVESVHVVVEQIMATRRAWEGEGEKFLKALLFKKIQEDRENIDFEKLSELVLHLPLDFEAGEYIRSQIKNQDFLYRKFISDSNYFYLEKISDESLLTQALLSGKVTDFPTQRKVLEKISGAENLQKIFGSIDNDFLAEDIFGKMKGRKQKARLVELSRGKSFHSRLAEMMELKRKVVETEAGHQRVGFVDTLGHFAIKPEFYQASAFSEGYAVVDQGSTWGVIDGNGDFTFAPRPKGQGAFSLSTFANGKARIMVDDQWVVINPQGDILA